MVSVAGSTNTSDSVLIGSVVGAMVFLVVVMIVVIITCIVLFCFIKQAKKKKTDL